MAEVITLELSDTLARQTRTIAMNAHRRFEDMLVELIERSLADLPLESLPDERVLELCALQLDIEQQTLLDDLLSRNQEGQLTESETRQLDELMRVYRRGLVRKAKAWNVAVERGLKAPLN